MLEVLGAVDTDVFSRFLREVLGGDVARVIAHLEELIMQGRELSQFVVDFTWYMRNLLLIKTSDNMEDVLDVSSENLEQLREEAGMIREDTLMRFIRIFSELSGQMKYASSKRVLLEVALIKLCHPQMETDEISLVERIRRLEKRLEEGVLVQQQPVKASAAQTEPEQEREEAGEELADAAPEDLKRVMGMWKSIVAQTQGRFRVVLASAVPKYNTEGDDQRLYVVFADFLAEPYIHNKEKQEELERLIADKLGKHVEVRMVLKEDEGLMKGGRLSKIGVDEAVRKFVHTEISIEE